MDASNGPPVDSRLIPAPTVAPPPGVRPMSQPMLPQSLAPQLGLQGLAAGFRPGHFPQAAATGLPLFQAQAPPMATQSLGSRKAPLDRSKGVGGAGAGRKQCNCKNSRCLKLYCECFASGRYCENCNCVQCFNNREHEATRQSAVEAILERNPNAFRPKIQSNDQAPAAAAAVVNNTAVPGRHLKGCNCKKSSCLKKYCECFQAGIYCSDNCKCVECKNFEDSGSGAGGPGGGGAKRIRYGSAPPPPVPGSLVLGGTAAQGMALSAIRPGLVQPCGFGALIQQQHATGVSGLQMGLAGAVAAAAVAAGAPGGGARPGGPQGVVGSLAGLGPGGMAGLPQALSLALAAASGSAPQLLSLQPAAPASQSGPPLIVGPGASTLATATVPLPLRAKMQEVVNGMVKRSVIEELCRLLWMVADDEATPARSATTGGSGNSGAAATPQHDSLPGVCDNSATATMANGNMDSGGHRQRPGSADTGGGPPSGGLPRQAEGAATAHPAAGDGVSGILCDGASGGSGTLAPGGPISVKLEAGGMESHPLAGLQSHSQSPPFAGAANGGGEAGVVLVPEALADGALGEGAGAAAAVSAAAAAADAGATDLVEQQMPVSRAPEAPQQTQQQQPQSQLLSPRRPGSLYGRKERVVLEEFLSIMNKISDTAAKKLQQHSIAAAQATLPPPPPLHPQPPVPLAAVTATSVPPQPYGYGQAVPIVVPSSVPGPAVPQQQHQQPGAAAAAAAAAGPGVSGPQGSSYTALVRPSGHAGHVAMLASSCFPNGQVVYPLGSYPVPGVGANGQAGSAATVAALAQQSLPYGPTGVAAGLDGVVVVAPAVSALVGNAAATGIGEAEQQQQQHLHSLHGGVPVILAPPRGSHSSSLPGAPPLSHPPPQQQQQQQQQQKQPFLPQPPPQLQHHHPIQPQTQQQQQQQKRQQSLHAFDDPPNQPSGGASYPTPFIAYSTALAVQPDAIGNHLQQRHPSQRQDLPQQQQQQALPQPDQQPDSLLQGIMAASEQLAIWSPAGDEGALLQAIPLPHQPQSQHLQSHGAAHDPAAAAARSGAAVDIAVTTAAVQEGDQPMSDVDGSGGGSGGGDADAMDTAAL